MLEKHVKSAVLPTFFVKKSGSHGSSFLNASRNHDVIGFVYFK
jgi:hypothetical protein